MGDGTTEIYLWIEDCCGKSGYSFWGTFMQQLFPNVLVESKKNNSQLIKSVKALNDEKNRYIIVYDNSFDNLQVYHEQKILKKYADMRSNVLMLDIICFEFILLEFDHLINWIYAPDDEFLTKRAGAINAREKLIEMLHTGDLNYKLIREVIEYDTNLYNHNIEQLSAKLLFDLTRNTGFEVTKGKLGECWTKSCCDWVGREENDLCGLDNSHLSVADKMKSIYIGTSLNKEFYKVGLEAKL